MSSTIDSISQVTTPSLNTSTAKNSKDAVMGKEDFLSLLVAQLQHQDPLNPAEPTEFTAQLAQFSSLEQLFTLNDGMKNLVAANANFDRMSTLGTIGKEVTYHTDSFKFTGQPVQIGYQLDGQASEVTMSIQQNGVTVATIDGKELATGSHLLAWNGQTAANKQAPPGDYKIIINAKSATEESIAAAPLVRSEVIGVDLNGEAGGVLLTRAGEVNFASILGVYEPSTGQLAATATGEE